VTDSVVYAGETLTYVLRFTQTGSYDWEQGAPPLVRPGCWTTAKAAITFREVATGEVHTRHWGRGEECDFPYHARVGSVFALDHGETYEMRRQAWVPPSGEYEAVVTYSNEPTSEGEHCEDVRRGGRSGHYAPQRQEVLCQMEESAPCEIISPPIRVVVEPERVP